MVLNTKLLLPVALGLSLVTVSAFVVYYVFKNDEDEEQKDNLQIKTSRTNVIEVTVPKSIVPALIGRNRSNIKEIEIKSGANIHFKKFSDKEYEVCIIRGRTETTQIAETLIYEFIKNQPVIEEDSIQVPSWACGRIIGTGGDNINDISHRSGARVKVESLTSTENNTMRQVTFRGTKQQIQEAKILVEQCVAQEKCRREIEQSKRSPRHVQPPPAHAETPNEMPGDANTANTHKHVTNKKSEVTGAAIEVYVSAVSSPSRFWVQFVGPQVAQLDELVQEMTDYYSNKDNREAHALRSVSAGQLVAAVFRHDGRWYRARVAALAANEFDAARTVADVFYVDYGDSEYVAAAAAELCELRPDMLRLRFQAMECFLAGARPAGAGGAGARWPPAAVERFEELTQVARWKPLVSKTCTYKKSASGEGEKEKEIPGIKLYDVTEEGEVDIGATLIAEGWAQEVPPAPAAPPTPFGDLGNSRVLGMLGEHGDRSTSLPHDNVTPNESNAEDSKLNPLSTSLAAGLEHSDRPATVSPTKMAYADADHDKAKINGSHDSFLDSERLHSEKNDTESETVPMLSKTQRDELKANMNRIDSHHNNLEALARHSEHV